MKAFKPYLFVILFAVVALWLGMMAFSALGFLSARKGLDDVNRRQRYTGCFEKNEPTREEIEYHAVIELPASATNFDPYSEDFCGTSFYLRFEMAHAVFTKFIGSTKVSLPMSTTDKPPEFNHLPDGLGWNLYGVKTYWAGVGGMPYMHQQSILIDRSDPNEWIVYMIVKDSGPQ